MHPAIRVQNLAKQFRLGAAPRGRPNLTERLRGAVRALGRRAPAAPEFWALRDVSFDVRPGEVIGIVGRNGAGKSTLLKILSRIVEPTSGRAELRGRVGSLLEVGTGFHSELTGRENVYLNGSLLGMTRHEIGRKFDEIVAFAGVEQFLDTPVKRYSSGMYVRLAFAVAAHLEPEILIVDEVLAVGDAEFQNRCMGKMRAVSAGGRTVLFVSHNMTAVQNLCSRCVWLRDGRVAADGPARTVVEDYNRAAVGSAGAEVDLTMHRGRTSESVPAMRRVRVADATDGRAPAVPMRGTARVEVEFEFEHPVEDVTLGVVVKDGYQTPLFGINNKVTGGMPQPRPVRAGRVVCQLADLPLMPGVYPLDLFLGTRTLNIDTIYNAAELTVLPADVFGTGHLPPPNAGPICWPAVWELVPADQLERKVD
ncbi:MAG: ABC transporter ATP-binding protein [Planctomycetes bacterium]|nr:ABC transporter ATP-binding protein [Planctomycetota bacterium]